MITRKRFLVTVVLIAFMAALLTPMAAMANETGKKHTAITLGAVAAGLLTLTRHTTLGILTGAGAVYSYSQYQREHNQNQRTRAYRQGYRRGQQAARSSTSTSYSNR